MSIPIGVVFRNEFPYIFWFFMTHGETLNLSIFTNPYPVRKGTTHLLLVTS